MCPKDQAQNPNEAGILKQDPSQANPNFYLRFPTSIVEKVPNTFYQLGCEGLKSGLGYDQAGQVNLQAIRAEFQDIRVITLNCTAGRDFELNPFVNECESAQKGINDLKIAYADLFAARGMTGKSCSELFIGLKDLTELNLEKKSLTDIRPLRHLANLENLILRNNWIEDATPLALLSRLQTLDLGDNPDLTQISSLSQLSRLNKLVLNSTRIPNLAVIKSLKSLKELDVSHVLLSARAFDDLRGLNSLKGLTFTADYVEWNADDQSFFSNCAVQSMLSDSHKKSLGNILTATGTSPGNIDLAKCNLAYVKLMNRSDLDLRPYRCIDPDTILGLRDFKNLGLQLDMSSCDLKTRSLETLATFPKLKFVDISKNALTDFRPLTQWKNIASVELTLGGNEARGSKCPVDTGNPQLTAYCSSSNNPFVELCAQAAGSIYENLYSELFRISSVTPGQCSQLYDRVSEIVSLDLSGKKLSGLGPLQYLKNLQVLNLSRTDTRDLLPLKSLVNLVELDVSDNDSLEQLNGIEALANLKKLDVSATAISDLTTIGNLKELSEFAAENNVRLRLPAFEALKLTKVETLKTTNTPMTWDPERQTFFTNCLVLSSLPRAAKSTVLQLLKPFGFGSDRDGKPTVSCTYLHKVFRESQQLDLRPFKYLDGETKACLDVDTLLTLQDFQLVKDLKIDLSSCPALNPSKLGNLKNLSWLDLRQTPVGTVENLVRDNLNLLVDIPDLVSEFGTFFVPAIISQTRELKGGELLEVQDSCNLFRIVKNEPRGWTVTLEKELTSNAAGCSADYLYSIGNQVSNMVTVRINDCRKGYVFVPADNYYVREPFCVMQREAERDINDPWSRVKTRGASLYEARQYCQSDSAWVINNSEWMALAVNLMSQDKNWVGGKAGQGSLHTGNTIREPCSSGIDEYPYSDYLCRFSDVPNGEFSLATRRTMYLSTGETVWDIAGNLNEWVDLAQRWRLDPPPPNTPAMPLDMRIPSHNPFWDNSWNIQTGIGTVSTSQAENWRSLGVRRGGSANPSTPDKGGIFALEISVDPYQSDSFTGFRCTHPL